jgi:hypothetical protein
VEGIAVDEETRGMLAEMLEELGCQNGTLVLACHPGRWAVVVTRGPAEGPDAHQGPLGAAPRLRDALTAPHAWLCLPPPEAPGEQVPG